MMPSTEVSQPSLNSPTQTDNMAQGYSGLNPEAQGLIQSGMAQGTQDDTSQLMEGVDNGAKGFLGKISSSSLGETDPEGFSSALHQQMENQVGNSTANMKSYLEATSPLRKAVYQKQAAENLAKVTSLNYNNYMLYNQQQLQSLQLAQAQAAASQQMLGDILGIAGTALGMGAAALVPGVGIAGLAAGALAGGSMGKGVGEMAGK